MQSHHRRKFENVNLGPKAGGNTVVAGEIIEALPNTMFKVRIDNNREVIGIPSGKMRRGFMRMLPGVRVMVEMTPYDDKRGRIVGKISK